MRIETKIFVKVNTKELKLLCNGGQHYVPYRCLLIYNKLCDSTSCTCGGVGGGEEQVHNVDYDPVTTEAVDMNGRFQMQGGKNWILPK